VFRVLLQFTSDALWSIYQLGGLQVGVKGKSKSNRSYKGYSCSWGDEFDTLKTRLDSMILLEFCYRHGDTRRLVDLPYCSIAIYKVLSKRLSLNHVRR